MRHQRSTSGRGAPRPWPVIREAFCWVRAPLLLFVIAAFLLPSSTAVAQDGVRVLVTEVDGPITPVIADHLEDGIRAAEENGHSAFVVELDTPGGLDASMRDIVRDFFGARVPVVVYVAPSGARAASAGTFITMAAHVAAMAPATTIGAATPVDLEGGEISDKIINDAVSFAVSVAGFHDRDIEFAVDAVREGRSITADEAVQIGAVDLVVRDTDTLLEMIDGRTVIMADGSRTASPEMTVDSGSSGACQTTFP